MAANPEILNKLSAYIADKTGGNPPTGGDKDKGKGDKPSERIPLPDYNNPESRQNFANAFRNKYGKETLAGYGDIPLRLNEKPYNGNQYQSDKTGKQLAIEAASGVGIDPALLYSSAMIEGMSGLYLNKTGNIKTKLTGNDQYPVAGSANFGLDNFAGMYPEFVKRGYLKDDFKNNFIPYKSDNPNETQNSASFKSVADALKAKAAYMKYEYDEIDNYAKKKGITLTPEQRDFFASARYNSGTHSQELLDAYNKAGALKDNSFLNKMPSVNVPFMYQGKQLSPEAAQKLHKQIYGNVIPRLHAARGLKAEAYFDNTQEQTIPTQQQTSVPAAPTIRQKPIPAGAKIIETSEGRGYFHPQYGNFVKID